MQGIKGDIMNEITVGSPAPDFCLPDMDEKNICLNDFKGHFLVIYFYPKDNTSACTLEAKNFTEEEKDFSALLVPVIGISPDPPQRHRKFIEKQGLKVHLLSDVGHDVLEKYGVWKMKKMYGKEYMGVERSTFIIDPQGTIAALWRKVKVKGHVDEVKSTLNGLIMQK
jgi:peroxiredoxin Q/BCP